MKGLIEPGRKVLRFPHLLAALKAGQAVRPIHIEMDLTNRCNLACSWCDFRYTHDGAVMPADLAVRILVDLSQAGVKAVTFTGGGEPTIHPHFDMIARTARGVGLDLGLYTNLVDIRRLRESVDCFSWVYASVDATDPVEYRVAKGVDAFEKVCRNLREMSREKPASTVLGMGYLMNADNYGRAVLAVRQAADLGADYVQFRPAVGLGDYSWVAAALQVAMELARGGSPVPVYYSPERFLDMVGFQRSYKVCRGSALVPCIGAGGDLWVCVNTRGIRKLGNLRDNSFGDLWAARPVQLVGPDCRVACRNHALNETLEYVCSEAPHAAFV